MGQNPLSNLRCCDINQVLPSLATDQLDQVKARLVEGTEVLVEGGKVGGRQAKEEGVRLTAEVKSPSRILHKMCLPQVQHTDWVTDLAMCETTQTLLVSSSNDGCIKVWK